MTNNFIVVSGRPPQDKTAKLVELQNNYAVRTETSGSVTYVGKAEVGSASSSAKWQIQKIDETSGTVITWADGNALFDNIWDDRATLSYS